MSCECKKCREKFSGEFNYDEQTIQVDEYNSSAYGTGPIKIGKKNGIVSTDRREFVEGKQSYKDILYRIVCYNKCEDIIGFITFCGIFKIASDLDLIDPITTGINRYTVTGTDGIFNGIKNVTIDYKDKIRKLHFLTC